MKKSTEIKTFDLVKLKNKSTIKRDYHKLK